MPLLPITVEFLFLQTLPIKKSLSIWTGISAENLEAALQNNDGRPSFSKQDTDSDTILGQ